MLPDITFTGTNGNECEAFIVAIRDLAFAQGRDEDHHWMLRFATTRLRGKALRWHARLEPSIKQDWDLFVQALFEEYSFVEESGGLEIATPVRYDDVQSPPSRHYHRYLIKVVLVGLPQLLVPDSPRLAFPPLRRRIRTLSARVRRLAFPAFNQVTVTLKPRIFRINILIRSANTIPRPKGSRSGCFVSLTMKEAVFPNTFGGDTAWTR